ncbi:MAG TPA: TonB-dependent receptor, partial [Bacteroidales bacterium]|nr:TonB-dependent receptor [Bacteroidales bacterium]
MKKVFLLLAALPALSYQAIAKESLSHTQAEVKSIDSLVHAQPEVESTDSLSHIRLEEVVVSSTRAGQQTPVAYSNINILDIKRQSAARSIPVTLQSYPSVVAFTEDGLGVGNTSLRIRGTDATRVNVTLNGMPLNNPESQELFWVNLPDLSSSLQSMQIQRGVGTSTNGAGAFGASISLQTAGGRPEAYGEASTAVGSYGTFLSNIAAGSGILRNGLSLDVRFSRMLGNGYVRNGKVDHSNLYAALSHYTDRQLIRLVYLNGVQQTGITWEGVSLKQMEDEEYGRRYNPAGEYYDDAGNRFYYDNETDNYWSHIVQLNLSRELNRGLVLNAGLCYNHGYGYYENYRQNRKYSDFGLEPQTIGDYTYTRSDFIRRKSMWNDFYVANAGVTYHREAWQLTFGSMHSYYDGDHFGRLPWVKHNHAIPLHHEWYRNVGKKRETNLFSKVEYQPNERLSLFGDLQYRHIGYRFSGIDDDLMNLTGHFKYDFLNPKAGASYRLNDRDRFYLSVSIGQREPLRSDLKDGLKGNAANPIQPERMVDYELGYHHEGTGGERLSVNLYYMDYHDQMVQTGKLNDNGYKLMENVKESYRAGIEIEASVPLWAERVRIDANATFSRNRIKGYTAYFDLYDSDYNPVHVGNDPSNTHEQLSQYYGTTPISYSPSLVSAMGVTYQPTGALYLNLAGKQVSKQFLDNSGDKVKSIDAYFIVNLSAGYTFTTKSLGTFQLQLFVNNL